MSAISLSICTAATVKLRRSVDVSRGNRLERRQNSGANPRRNRRPVPLAVYTSEGFEPFGGRGRQFYAAARRIIRR